METKIENRVTLKIFIGCPISSEIRLKLNHSLQWKQAKILADKNSLVETHFQDKDYLGLFLEYQKVPLSELKLTESFLKKTILSYIPDLENEKIKVVLFSQIFIQ